MAYLRVDVLVDLEFGQMEEDLVVRLQECQLPSLLDLLHNADGFLNCIQSEVGLGFQEEANCLLLVDKHGLAQPGGLLYLDQGIIVEPTVDQQSVDHIVLVGQLILHKAIPPA